MKKRKANQHFMIRVRKKPKPNSVPGAFSEQPFAQKIYKLIIIYILKVGFSEVIIRCNEQCKLVIKKIIDFFNESE